ncbi:uncharacterized protein LOC112351400 isoform X1 [Selaginella moellendorffii]|uniref:uncharacterized protein LOC112351400 isoform X1 n=1 Tax=Selaginella moellendorffii TaxID=88036 RepID=UPI000D1CC0C6|nr:uncharacterized protein LOC112351400 isoform X1 [Selaginella moellendorffii]|eukprot:XP_024545036.1 uncharacterized protein LOC112351400 isoform X1 [Selaginella moellendorffii]
MASKDAIHPAAATSPRPGDPYVPGDSTAALPGTGSYFRRFQMRTITGNISEDHLDKVTINLAVYGAGLVLVGLVAIVFPLSFTLAIGKLISWLLVFGGAMALIQFFFMCGAPGTSSFLLLGALYMIVGLLMVIHPLRSGTLLIVVMAMWFLLHGVFKAVMASQVRNFATWPTLMGSGVISVVLAFLVLLLAPRLGLVTLAVVFGMDLLLSGVSMLLLSCVAFFGTFLLKYCWIFYSTLISFLFFRCQARGPLVFLRPLPWVPGSH